MTHLAAIRAGLMARPALVAAVVEFFDNFNRANQVLENDPRYALRAGSAAGSLRVVSSRLHAQTTSNFVDIVQGFGPDIEVSFSAIAGTTNNSFIVVRQQANGDYLGLRTSNANVQVFSFLGGAYTNIFSVGGVSTDTVVRYELIGAEIRTFLNNSLVGVTTVPAGLLTGEYVALHARTTNLVWLDNLRIKALSTFSG